MRTLSHIFVALLLVFLVGNSCFADYSAVRARRNAGFGCRTFKPRRAVRNLNRYGYYPRRFINQPGRFVQSRHLQARPIQRPVVQYPKTAAERQAMYQKAQFERFKRQRSHRARFNRQ